ncbi:MAG: hypothetical protein HYS32_02915 [Candidatus Woesearchaeota archaeon]|nr:MAG: hypothetical protein HYS32_02915 [Candidatus Woesearchaeota archaeon]
MNTHEFEIIVAAIFLVVFLGFFFNSGVQNIITGSTAANLITAQVIAPLQIPSELSITINKNDYSTDKNKVVLRMFSLEADECRYRNNDGNWSPYESYSSSKHWALTPSLGEKTVYYQCKNEIGESEAVSDSIIVIS